MLLSHCAAEECVVGPRGKPLLGSAKTNLIECRLSSRKRAEDPVEQKESDAEVLVHQSLVVQYVVVNVMESARRKEPALEQSVPGQPEALDVHDVMQPAEHEEAPAKRAHEINHLIDPAHVKSPEQCQHTGYQQCRGCEPLHPDIAEHDGLA